MKWILLVTVTTIGLALSTTSEAGVSCTDACSGAVGERCVDFNLGCDPRVGQCVRCTVDSQCEPGGTCNVATGDCNINCNAIPDAGTPEAGPGDTGPADNGTGDANSTDGAPDQGPADGPALDMNMPGDSGPVDTGVVIPDQGIREVGTPGGGGKNMLDPNRKMDEDCSCSSTSSRGGGLVWFVFLALGFVRRRQA